MIQQNINAAEAARRNVRKHCMAFRIRETASHLTVIFPLGYRLDGVRVSMANGAKWAYDKALEKMEATWKQ